MILFHICLFWMMVNVIQSKTIDNAPRENKYEEYIVEHEISESEAKKNSFKANLDNVNIPAGCQKCTAAEIEYCHGSGLINDHCCCDKRYHENLPYIPHTCYIGNQLCTIDAGECARYTQLLKCCCDKYTLEKWKEKYKSDSQAIIIANAPKISYILVVFYLIYKFF